MMGHRPAPIQASYIGFPTSTGSPYIDYYLADVVALPPEQRIPFTEKLALMPSSSIANDYAQLRGGVLALQHEHRSPRHLLDSDVDISEATTTFLFATLSNFQKFCPSMFQTWMNILNRFPGSKMVWYGNVMH